MAKTAGARGKQKAMAMALYDDTKERFLTLRNSFRKLNSGGNVVHITTDEVINQLVDIAETAIEVTRSEGKVPNPDLVKANEFLQSKLPDNVQEELKQKMGKTGK